MRIKVFLFILILLGIIFLSFFFSHKSVTQNVLFKDVSGGSTYLKDLQGKWIIINFWADWCEPCAREIPQLNSFYKEHRDKVIIYGYHFDHLEISSLKNMIQSFHIRYPVLIEDPSFSLGIENIFAIPTTCFISPHGKLKTCIAGEQSKSSLEKMVLEKLDS